jgi:hypothetical protein
MGEIRRYRNHQDRTGKCSVDGYSAEKTFKALLEDLGANPQASNIDEQFEGIDIHAWCSLKFDVKARKRRTRNDEDAQDDFIWVEFKNVRGNKGWLYGQADYIAFERASDFIIVDRAELASLCETLVDLSANVIEANKALYKGYQRKGRKDLIAMIKFSDVLDYTDFLSLDK